MWDWFSLKWFGWPQLSAFHWVSPYFLYGILAIPLFFLLRRIIEGRSRQKLRMAFTEGESPRSLTAGFRHLFSAIVFGFIAMILIALARPQIISQQTENTSEGINIVIAMDVSESMLDKDLRPNRLEAAKTVAKAFIQNRFQDRIGLVIFAGEAYTLCPLTTDYDLLVSFLGEINQNSINTSGTAIGTAVGVAINRLRDSEKASKTIILISDGDNTAGSLDPITAAQLAKAYGIRIYTVLVGIPKKQPPTTDSTASKNPPTADEGVLQNIASVTNGRFFKATDNTALQNIFREINQLERVELKSRQYVEVQDFYRVYLYWAFFFLILIIILKSTFVVNVLED